MAGMTRWFGISLVIHLGVGGCLAYLAAADLQQQPVIIDFTLEAANHAAAGQAAPRSQAPASARKQTVRPDSVPNNTTPEESLPTPVLKPDAPVAPQPEQKAPPAAASTGPSSTGTAATAVQQTTGAVTVKGSDDSRKHAVELTADEGGTATRAKADYLRQHFAYIRNNIMRYLIYPDQARRRDWSGVVVLSFIVAENGAVHSLKVHKSSGHPILDRSALDAVNQAAPFPRPPVRAEILLPITYHLL